MKTTRQHIRETWQIRDDIRLAAQILDDAGGSGSYFADGVWEYEHELTEDIKWLIKGAREEDAKGSK